jgi:hypothetical protein
MARATLRVEQKADPYWFYEPTTELYTGCVSDS